MEEIKVSILPKTWIFDLDGTIVIHNGYKQFGKDVFLLGAKEFLRKIPEEDMIIFLTSRKKEYQEITERFLKEQGIRWNTIIYEAPYGERILVNDKKPSGLPTAIAVNTVRDVWIETEKQFVEDESL